MTKVYLVIRVWETTTEVKIKRVWRVYTNKKKALKAAEELQKQYPNLAGEPAQFIVEEEPISTI